MGINYQANALAANAVVQRIRALGAKARAAQADVAKKEQVQAMFADVGQLGDLQDLVNSAGVVDIAFRVDAMTVARFERMFDTNVIGVMVRAREAVLRISTLHSGAGGAIVSFSSVASPLGSADQYVDYTASKGAIDSSTAELAREWRLRGLASTRYALASLILKSTPHEASPSAHGNSQRPFPCIGPVQPNKSPVPFCGF